MASLPISVSTATAINTGTIVAVNVGGAVIPTFLSIYLLAKNNLWVRGIITTAVVAAVVHYLAYPVKGVGIAVPTFVPPP